MGTAGGHTGRGAAAARGAVRGEVAQQLVQEGLPTDVSSARQGLLQSQAKEKMQVS